MLFQEKDKKTDQQNPIEVRLDQFELGELKLPALSSLKSSNSNSIYSTPDPITNEVKLTKEQKYVKSDSPKIGIIDSSEIISSTLISEKKENTQNINIIATHLGSVAHVIADQGYKIEKIFDVKKDNANEIDSNKINTSLKYLLDNNIKLDALNISMTSQMSFDELNKLIKEFNLNSRLNEEINAQNINKYSKLIIEVLEKQAKSDSNNIELKNKLEMISLLQGLSDKGITICMSAGNNAETHLVFLQRLSQTS